MTKVLLALILAVLVIVNYDTLRARAVEMAGKVHIEIGGGK